MKNKDKSNSLFGRFFFKPYCTLIWNSKLFPRFSKNYGKSGARTVGKILRALDVGKFQTMNK